MTSLLLLPLLIGGYLAAVLVFKAAHGVAAAPWRAAILIGYALVGALLTDLIAGPGIGAYSSSHFWPLLPCFWLITSAVALAAAAVQALVGKLGTLLVAVLFIVIGGPPAGDWAHICCRSTGATSECSFRHRARSPWSTMSSTSAGTTSPPR
ncbi:hypothetical protein SHKM778_03010 [Streptomyces sp. KM77-8]|uniref:DUF2878 domain-containing protein n=1 Tax=Streptomyces haneummycinicus TaxID=3074435 RepID=A0AAT9H936_9ACTN